MSREVPISKTPRPAPLPAARDPRRRVTPALPTRAPPFSPLRRQLRHVTSRPTSGGLPRLPSSGAGADLRAGRGGVSFRPAPAGREGRDQASPTPSLKTKRRKYPPPRRFTRGRGNLGFPGVRRGGGRCQRCVAGLTSAGKLRLPSGCAVQGCRVIELGLRAVLTGNCVSSPSPSGRHLYSSPTFSRGF